MKVKKEHARLVRKAEAFPLKIADVVEFDELERAFPRDHNPTLASVSKVQLNQIVEKTCRGAKRGEAVFFLSRDRQRARAIIVLSRKPPVYAVASLAFGLLTPELVISIWMAQQLGVKRQATLQHVLGETGRSVDPLAAVAKK